MPININEFRRSILNISNKWRSGHLPPSRMDDFIQKASIELFNEKRGKAAASEKINDDLAPFLKSENLPVSAPEGLNFGLVKRPASEYNYFWSMRVFFMGGGEDGKLISCGCPSSDNSACDASRNLIQPLPVPTELLPIVKEKRVTIVDAGRWDSVLNHRFKFPTVDDPYGTQYSEGWKVAPRNLSVVTLDNYRLPKPAVFGYTQLPSGYFQYNPATSTDIEWPSQVDVELLDRVLRMFAIYLGNPNLYAASKDLIETRV